MYGAEWGPTYGASGMGSLGFSIGGALKSIGKGIVKVVGKPVEVVSDIAHGNFKEAAKDLAVTGALIGGGFLAPAALGAARVVGGAVASGVSGLIHTGHTVTDITNDALPLVHDVQETVGVVHSQNVLVEPIPPRTTAPAPIGSVTPIWNPAGMSLVSSMNPVAVQQPPFEVSPIMLALAGVVVVAALARKR